MDKEAMLGLFRGAEEAIVHAIESENEPMLRAALSNNVNTILDALREAQAVGVPQAMNTELVERLRESAVLAASDDFALMHEAADALERMAEITNHPSLG
jgi:hypothetical protein